MNHREPRAWSVAAVLSAGLVLWSCGGGSGSSPTTDPTLAEIQALEQVASSMEADLQAGGGRLLNLAERLAERMTPEDVTTLVRNYQQMMESYRMGEPWQPADDFYALVDRLRDLPFFSEMPSRSAQGSRSTAGLASRSSALFLSNAKPVCGLSCEAQGALYGLLDYGAGEVKKYYADLLFSGVDCLQDAAKMGKCVAAGTCAWGDFTLFVGGCASLSANVALEVSGASKVKTAYVLLKKVLSIWSVGSLASSFADWVSACKEFQAQDCPRAPCDAGQKVCLAVNGAGSTCCPGAQSCAECVSCTVPCGLGCCVVGQRCDAGECATCASACGPTCCTQKEICANPEIGLCAPCDNPCGLTCCPAATTCVESLWTCCENPCGSACCNPDESCIGSPPRCCATPCGDDCCAPGQVCDPDSTSCKNPPGCGASQGLDCQAVCAQALAQAKARCDALGGTLSSTDTSECVAACKCLVAEVPNLLTCMSNPACPGCEQIVDALSAAQQKCGRAEVLCSVPPS